MLRIVLLADLVLLTAQTPAADAIAGGAGWAGAGILGLVLSWLLLVHLPAKDKQLEKMIDGRDKLAGEFADDLMTQNKEGRADFREALERIATHCEKDMQALAQAIHKDIESLGAVVREAMKR